MHTLTKEKSEALLKRVEASPRGIIVIDWQLLRVLLVLAGVAKPYTYEPRIAVPPLGRRVVRLLVPRGYVCFACKTHFELSADDVFNITFVADGVPVWSALRTTNQAGKIGVDWCRMFVASYYRSVEIENTSGTEEVVWLHHTGTLIEEPYWKDKLKPFFDRVLRGIERR